MLPWSIQNPVALVFDEYDAGRPDVMFVIQRILEVEGKLTLLDQNKVIKPHPSFRLFATTNTVGLGDVTGLYHGTQQINQGQMDRWHILSTLNYLDANQELKVVLSKVSEFNTNKNQEILINMIKLANLTRSGFENGDISILMSPRTVISWAQNYKIFKDVVDSFKLTFLNKCDDLEKPIIAEYFQRLSLERGAVHINSRVIESHVDEEGYVKSLKLANDQTVDCDFIFDCSGFLRLFVEKTYKSKFKSYKKYLPVDSAIPFFLERSGETPTYTEAIALSSGWMWKTPVDGRFGCGYVFDSNYIDKDEALQELTNLLGFEPKINKHITFESGYFETPWNKNVLAVGLSSGFLEPLEATSIWITVISLQLFIEHIRGFVNKDEKSIDEYNEQFTKSVESILALVQFHYFTKRNDSDFWREFRKKNEVVPLLQEILDIYSYRLPSNLEANKYNTFPPFSWYLVGAGLDYFEKDIIDSESKSYNIKESLSMQDIYDFKNNMNTVVDRCLQHNEFLRYLRGTQ
mgnify:CR=1 FL=1